MKLRISKEELYELYIVKNMSLNEIGKLFGVTSSLIGLRMKDFGIKKDKKMIHEKVKQTMLEKYGVENIFQNENTKKQIQETMLKKYGVDNISKKNEIKEKKKKTTLKNYGVESPMKSEIIKKRTKKTCIEKYGVENPMKSKEVQEKLKQTLKNKYNVEYGLQNKKIKAKVENKILKEFGVKNVLKNKNIKEKIKQTNLKRYGVPYACMTEQCKKANGYTKSKVNKSFSQKLKENYIKNKLEFNLEKFSYDIQLLESNILIEINPTYTHNSTNSIIYRNHIKKPLKKEYHYNKTITAKENGYRCIHIFDWDDKDKIINILKPKEKIYARNLDCKEITQKQCTEFLEKYHLQGSCKGQNVRLGLFYKNELVEIMTFGKPRYNKNYEWELLRLCSHSNYNIIGGANRLFTHFLIAYKPNSIISYCDNSKFDGSVYKWLNFKLINYGKPSKHWYNPKTKQHITDNLLRQRGFDQLFGTNYGKGTSNKGLMIQNEFVEIYDSGQSTYVYKEENNTNV